MNRNLSGLLAFVGAADCVLVPSLFTAAIQQPFFPLPGIYFIEIGLFGLLGLASGVRPPSDSSKFWRAIPWLASGILLAFNVLGAWTIGFFLIPATLSFLVVGVILAEKQSQNFRQGLILFLFAGLIQAGLMLVLVGIS